MPVRSLTGSQFPRWGCDVCGCVNAVVFYKYKVFMATSAVWRFTFPGSANSRTGCLYRDIPAYSRVRFRGGFILSNFRRGEFRGWRRFILAISKKNVVLSGKWIWEFDYVFAAEEVLPWSNFLIWGVMRVWSWRFEFEFPSLIWVHYDLRCIDPACRCHAQSRGENVMVVYNEQGDVGWAQ